MILYILSRTALILAGVTLECWRRGDMPGGRTLICIVALAGISVAADYLARPVPVLGHPIRVVSDDLEAP